MEYEIKRWTAKREMALVTDIIQGKTTVAEASRAFDRHWFEGREQGMTERVIGSLKEQCIHRHRFESLQHASRVVGDWISFYSNRRPHQALGMKTPAEAFALAV
jgi:transposase InsO family protein